ncbi:MAG: TerC/Alx family metal homeostasis membrane protein [Acidobacteriota bacterium]
MSAAAPVSTIGTPLALVVFFALIGLVLVLDLGVLSRRQRPVSQRDALLWTAFCVLLALGFCAWIAIAHGSTAGLEFLAGYLVEYALSVDNLFVFLIVFNYFAVPKELRHGVLFWGIVGAIALRAAFVATGAVLLAAAHWVIYLFGAFLFVTGGKLLFTGEDGHPEPARNPVVRLLRRYLPLAPSYHGRRFFVRHDGRRLATPLFLVLVVVEVTDLVFAVDSIPAVFGVTRDPFLVFTSNIFAVLGLRALFFLIAGWMDRFHYLKFGLGLVLAFVGVKMLASAWWTVPITASLGIIVSFLAAAMIASWLFPPRGESGPRAGGS